MKLNRTFQKHTIFLLKQGIGKAYVTVDSICTCLFELWATQRKRELQNEKFLSTVGLEPIPYYTGAITDLAISIFHIICHP